MSLKMSSLLIVASLMFLGCAQKSTTDIVAVKAAYMPNDLYNEFKSQIPDFPKKGSKAQLADEAELRKLQKSRTEIDCKRAESEVVVTLQSFYGPPYGLLTESQVKTLEPLFEQIRQEGGPYIGRTKKGYSRLRPYEYVKGLTPCIHKEPSMAYPSGHATLGELYGLVLIELMPLQKDVILKRSEQISLDRVLAGVHHPTDIESGKKLGQLIFNELKKSPTYNEDIERFKKLL